MPGNFFYEEDKIESLDTLTDAELENSAPLL